MKQVREQDGGTELLYCPNLSRASVAGFGNIGTNCRNILCTTLKSSAHGVGLTVSQIIMALRIFIKFRTDQVPGPPAEKDLLVAKAACLNSLGRDFDFGKDFIHAQGEVLQEKARCHVLVDCDYHDTQPDPQNAVVRFYRVVEDEASLLVLCIHD